MRKLILALFLMLLSPSISYAQTTPKLNKRVLSVVLNPIIESRGGVRLIQLMGWNDPNYLNQLYIDALKEVSGGMVNYEVVEKMENLDFYPEKTDGFTFTDESYLVAAPSLIKPHNPDTMHYKKLFDKLNLCDIIKNKNIDEVWLWGGPWFGFWESAAAGKNAYWCNAPAMLEIDCGRLIFIMGFSYSRGGPMLESFSHGRVESTLDYALGSSPHDYWHQFSQVKFFSSSYNHSGCGNVHYTPNTDSWDDGYRWTLPQYEWSDCDDFYNYPNLTGVKKYIDCSPWSCSNCEERFPNDPYCPEGAKYLKWWLSHIPRATGKTNGYWNNWWLYMVDFENAIDPSYVYEEGLPASSTLSCKIEAFLNDSRNSPGTYYLEERILPGESVPPGETFIYQTSIDPPGASTSINLANNLPPSLTFQDNSWWNKCGYNSVAKVFSCTLNSSDAKPAARVRTNNIVGEEVTITTTIKYKRDWQTETKNCSFAFKIQTLPTNTLTPTATSTPIPPPTPPPSFNLSAGWNEISWPGITGFSSLSAISSINDDCGNGTLAVIGQKSLGWNHIFVAGFGGSNFNFLEGENYFIKASKDCRWLP